MTVTIRPMTEHDVDGARDVQTRSFAELDRKEGEPVHEVTDEMRESQRRRMRHFLANDPAGAWVADADGQVVGVALALKRDELWGLSLLVVDPDVQSRGVGKQLLDAALTYADPDGRAVILSSRDPRAMRRYASAGFDLHPQIRASGALDPDRLAPASPRVRPGGADDAALADSVDRHVRRAARGRDHEILLWRCHSMYVVDDDAGRGYAYLERGGAVHTLAATDEVTATELLWACLRDDAERDVTADVWHITGNQQWAVRTVVAAGLRLAPSGPVFYRGMTPPPAYLPSGPYL